MRILAPLIALAMLAACGPDGSSSSAASSLAPSSAVIAFGKKIKVTPAVAVAAPSANHVVMFILDDLSVADANFMSSGPTPRDTPTIDALAAQSLVLGNYQVTTPICTPARYTLLTGNYASRATNRLFTDRLHKEGSAVPEFNALITGTEATLPKRLKALGYRTGFTGKDHMTDTNYGGIPANSSVSNQNVVKQLGKIQKLEVQGLQGMGFDEVYSVYPENVADWPVVELQAHNLDYIVEGAIKFIEANYDKKFFLVVSLTVPHFPWNADRSWNADPRVTPWGYLDHTPNVMPARSTLPARVKAAGFVSGNTTKNVVSNENFLWMDDAVGAVLGELAKRNLRDSTAIFLEGDHGIPGKGTIFLNGSSTPAMWNYHGITGRTNELVSNVDIQPTILQMAGGAAAGDGVSMMPLLNGQAGPVRQNLYLELGYARAVMEGDYEYIAVRHSPYIKSLAQTNGYMLTHWLAWTGPNSIELEAMGQFPHYLDIDQLYNIKTDPAQQVNLYGQADYQPIVNHLQTAMQAQANLTPGTFKVVQ